MDQDEIARRIWQYNWYHVIDLGNGLRTPGMEVNVPSQQKVLDAIRTIDFRGARVLDIGCRDGLYCFEVERLGAAEVIGIDNDLSAGAVELLIPAMQSRVQMRQMNLLDLTPDTFGRFDVILFAGVLYHLRYPFEAMKVIRDLLVEGGRVVVETAVFADANRHAYLYCPIGDENPYDATSVTLFNVKGLRDSLRSFGLLDGVREAPVRLRAGPVRLEEDHRPRLPRVPQGRGRSPTERPALLGRLARAALRRRDLARLTSGHHAARRRSGT